MTRKALIIVDLQNDFCPGGALGVKDGDKVVPVVNDLINEFTRQGYPVFATRDWHPPHHVSFKERGGPWPPHCVQNSEGARFHPDLKLPPSATVISKGKNPDNDTYSGFDGTDLAERLREDGVDEITVCGLATDYCVRATVLDGLKAGFKVNVVLDATRGVNVRPGDADRAIREMKAAGANLVD